MPMVWAAGNLCWLATNFATMMRQLGHGAELGDKAASDKASLAGPFGAPPSQQTGRLGPICTNDTFEGATRGASSSVAAGRIGCHQTAAPAAAL